MFPSHDRVRIKEEKKEEKRERENALSDSLFNSLEEEGKKTQEDGHAVVTTVSDTTHGTVTIPSVEIHGVVSTPSNEITHGVVSTPSTGFHGVVSTPIVNEDKNNKEKERGNDTLSDSFFETLEEGDEEVLIEKKLRTVLKSKFAERYPGEDYFAYDKYNEKHLPKVISLAKSTPLGS